MINGIAVEGKAQPGIFTDFSKEMFRNIPVYFSGLL